MIIEIGVFFLGLVGGSFLNVCIHRLPRGESIVRPRSYCPKCGTKIAWFENIPVLSFVLLRGRCRHCRGRISIRYPLVELTSGLIWVACWKASEGWTFFGISVIFLSLLLVAAGSDLETGLIPDGVTFSGIGFGLIFSFFYPGLHASFVGLNGLTESVVGILVGGALLYLTAIAGNWIFQRESMGAGDVKLLAMIGSFVGWEKILLTFFTAPVLGLPFALYRRWVKKEEVIPYGPFLCLAGAIHYFYGDQFWRLFLLV